MRQDGFNLNTLRKEGSAMKALYATLCALMVAGSASANITITGTGKITYTPDIAQVSVGASSEGKTAAEAWQKNHEVVRKMFEALRKLGLDSKDMKTAGLGVTPRYLYVKDQPPKLLGYTASYTLTLTVRNLDKLGTILDEAVECGANRDVGISFGCSNPEKLLDQARAAAIAEARKKAEIYVKGAGAALGQVQSISEGSSTPWQHFRYEHLAKATAAPLPIAAGEQEMSVTVTVTYGIVQPLRS
jgi:uncharacterized protein YggE